MHVPFVKYSGCGNDFIVVDNRTLHLNPTPGGVASLCERRTGIGADGVLLIEHSDKAAAKMRIFNADGTEAEMCGNGVRCVAHYLAHVGDAIAPFNIEAMHQTIAISMENDWIRTELPAPSPIVLDKKIQLAHATLSLHFLDTGVPHAVFFSDSIQDPAFPDLARVVRYHPAFAPKGTNVNLAKVETDQTVTVRTYERGVEGETLACGTGAAAAALSAAAVYHIPSPIRVRPASGEILTISFEGPAIAPTHVALTGQAIRICEGSFLATQFGFLS